MIDGYSSLPPKPPDLHLHDADLFSRQGEQPGERPVNVEGALHRAPHRDAVGVLPRVRDRQHPVRLDVELLLRARLVLAGDNDIRGGERGFNVTARDRVRLEDVVRPPDDFPPRQRFVDGAHRGQRVDLDGDAAPAFLQHDRVRVREQDDRLLRVVHAIGRQIRLVVGDERDDVPAGDVGGGDDRELIPGEPGRKADVPDRSPHDGTADRRSVQHAGQHEVVNVPRLPGDFRASFLAGNRSTDGGHTADLTPRVEEACLAVARRA